MPSFNIIRNNNIQQTYRVARIMSDFDVKMQHSNEQFEGNIELPEKWNIGLIVGGSGTGKTTIANELFKDNLITSFEWNDKSVLDNMPENIDIETIEKMFYSVGFGSVPSWLKPFKVLSNGEKMRVELARALLEKDFIVFDEFTSVVDRQIAQTSCIAINKAIKKTDKKFIAVSCHRDIIEWLQPDWIFDTDTMQMVFQLSHDHKSNLQLENAVVESGESLGNITI